MGNNKDIILAPGVSFNEELHQYHLKGKQLSGVTGRIGKHLGIKMPEAFVGEVRDEGRHVHKAVQTWIDTDGQNCGSIHPGVVWLTQTIVKRCENYPTHFQAEVLVSDLKQYASPVDICVQVQGDTLELFDIKRNFKREAVTWQLSIYQYFIEAYTPYRVSKLWCACIKDQDYYAIQYRGVAKVEDLLYKKVI